MVKFRASKFLLDRREITRYVDAATAKNLIRIGLFVRRVAINSQKPKRPGVYSSPGSPPHSHVHWKRLRENRERKKLGQAKRESSSGFKGLRHIEFDFVPALRSVIIGPVSRTGGVVTSLMEFGGTVKARGNIFALSGKLERDKRSGRFSAGKKQFIRAGTALVYRPRPFMRPALALAIAKFGSLWSDSIRVGGSSAVTQAA